MSSIREKFILTDINFLPEDVVDYVIKEYIPDEYFMYTNKDYYTRCHHLLKPCIQKYEQYLRSTIRRNHSFVFETIMRENICNWFLTKSYIYKGTCYTNYIYFIIDYCNENEAGDCRQAIVNYLRELGLCQNQHKKNVSRSIV
jgi:hypothetical protein